MKLTLNIDTTSGSLSGEGLLLNPWRAADFLNNTPDVNLQINLPLLMAEIPRLVGYNDTFEFFSPIEVLKNK